MALPQQREAKHIAATTGSPFSTMRGIPGKSYYFLPMRLGFGNLGNQPLIANHLKCFSHSTWLNVGAQEFTEIVIVDYLFNFGIRHFKSISHPRP